MKFSPITEETFEEAWNYGCRKYRRTKKTYLIRNVIFPAGLFLFSVSYLILIYGVLFTVFEGMFQPLLERIPYTAELWQTFSSLVFDRLPSLNWQLAAAAAVLYGPAAAAALGLTVILILFYHPAKPQLNEVPSLQLQSLSGLCENIRHYSTLWRKKSATTCRFLYFLLLHAVCMAYLYNFRNAPDVALVLQIGWLKVSLYFLLGFFMIYALYCLLIRPLYLFFGLLSYAGPDDHFVLDAEYYCRQKLELSSSQSAASPVNTQ